MHPSACMKNSAGWLLAAIPYIFTVTTESSMNEAATGTTSETATETTALGSLPEWDLSDLYSGIDAPELAADLARAGDDVPMHVR